MTNTPHNRPAAGIAFIVAGMTAISINDVMVRQLSGGYPLHQIVLFRSVIGFICILPLIYAEGGLSVLKTDRPFLHALRGLLIVLSNMTFFVAIAVAPLAEVTAIFFIAPLLITLLSIPMLGEKVGRLRMAAVAIGFAGVILMQRPWEGAEARDAQWYIMFLPVIAALCYAIMQLMTRKLGQSAKVPALIAYIQIAFILVSAGFYLTVGDGRFAEGTSDPSLIFLFRPWVWPQPGDWVFLVGLGLNSSIVGYCLSQAYRLADAATVSPFEYTGLPLAVFWGWLFWSEIPDLAVWSGIFLIMGAGLFVFFREQQKSRSVASRGIRRRA